MGSTEDLNQRIRELCARTMMAPDSEIQFVLEDLRAALREHAQLMRTKAAESLRQMPSDSTSCAKAADSHARERTSQWSLLLFPEE